MKKSIILLLILVGASANVFAGMTIFLQDLGSHQRATVKNDSDPVGIYQPGQSFETFCLETNEYYYSNRTYRVEISTVAHYNNYNPGKGYIEFDEDHLLIDGDPLDARTAYLYTNYMNNITWGYSALDFQKAIHYIEQETTTSNGLVTIADNAIANGLWDQGSLGNVRVMNVWYLDGTRAQDQLVMIPAPGAILLGGIGISLVGWIRKRKSL